MSYITNGRRGQGGRSTGEQEHGRTRGDTGREAGFMWGPEREAENTRKSKAKLFDLILFNFHQGFKEKFSRTKRNFVLGWCN